MRLVRLRSLKSPHSLQDLLTGTVYEMLQAWLSSEEMRRHYVTSATRKLAHFPVDALDLAAIFSAIRECPTSASDDARGGWPSSLRALQIFGGEGVVDKSPQRLAEDGKCWKKKQVLNLLDVGNGQCDERFKKMKRSETAALSVRCPCSMTFRFNPRFEQ